MSNFIETIAIGDELLTGRVSDSNSTFVGSRLFRNGIRLEKITVIADDELVMQETIRLAASRAKFVVCFGGLGPTSDDKTAEVVAKMLRTKVVEHETSKSRLLRFFDERKRQISPAALKQVLYPEGTQPLPNSEGLAPGFKVKIENATFYFLPGVPKEMYVMFDEHVLPDILGALGGVVKLRTKTWKCMGIPESNLQMLMNPVEAGLSTDEYLGYRTRFPENHLTLYQRLTNPQESGERFSRAEIEITKRLEPYCYTTRDLELEALIFEKLKSLNWKLSISESCTGGLALNRLTRIPGASEVIWGGTVVYRPEAKKALHTVLLSRDRDAVSADATRSLCDSLSKQSTTQITAAITGFLGPKGGDERDPVGTIYLCVLMDGQFIEERHSLIPRDRETSQWGAATQLLHLIWKLIEKK